MPPGIFSTLFHHPGHLDDAEPWLIRWAKVFVGGAGIKHEMNIIMNTTKYIAAFAAVALVAGVAFAYAGTEKDDANTQCEHHTAAAGCHMMKAESASCPMHAAKTESEPMSCCHKETASGCPMHAEAKPATAGCHGDHAADAKEAPAHAGHH